MQYRYICGIFGTISPTTVDIKKIKKLTFYSEQRGKDLSCLLYLDSGDYKIIRADFIIIYLISKSNIKNFIWP
jgi:hypothetical protein